MNINEIKEYLSEQYPDLRLNVNRNRQHSCVEVVGRLQYGFFVHEHKTSEAALDAELRTNLESLIDLAQNDLDKMKIKAGVKQEILGVQAVLVEGGEYWVSEADYVKLLNEGGQGPQSGAAMAFGDKPIKYHEAIV